MDDEGDLSRLLSVIEIRNLSHWNEKEAVAMMAADKLNCSCLLFNCEPPAVPFNSPAGCTSIQRQTSVRVGPLGRLKDHLSCNEEVIGCEQLEKSHGRPCAGCSGVAVDKFKPADHRNRQDVAPGIMVADEAKFILRLQVPLGETFSGIVRPIDFEPIHGRSHQTSQREPAYFLLMNSSSN